MSSLFELLNHIETEVMRLGNRSLDRLVLMYLVTRMDAGTGLVGVKSAISRGRMALDLSEKGGAGWRNRRIEYNDRDIQHCLDRLVKAGILVRQSTSKKMAFQFVFWADQLAQDNSVQKRVGRSDAGGWPVKAVNNHEVTGNQQSEVGREVGRNLNTTITNTNAREDEFFMHNDWLPVKGFADLAVMAGFQVKKGQAHRKLMDEAIVDVRLYWQSAKGCHRKENQHGWHHELIRTMKRLQVLNATPASGFVSAGTGKSRRLLKVPYNVWGQELQDWGMRHGFRSVRHGEEDVDYRRALVAHVERLNNQKESTGVV